MCWLSRGKTVEEIVAANSVGMTDAQKAEYWYELTQNIFAILGKVDVPMYEITPDDWLKLVQLNYPTLTDIKLADSKFFTTSLQGLQEILSRDWTNLVPYVAEISDCDKYAMRLYSHLCDFYKITAVVEVWGETTQGYHGFNLGVLIGDNNSLIARLIEPQTDAIFVDEGPLGHYTPQAVIEYLAIKKLPVGNSPRSKP